jgi:hypothetical protein
VFDGSDNSRNGLASNFRLQIDGLDCTNVITLDSFTVTTSKTSGITFPNLAITLLASHAATWLAWYEAFISEGNVGASQERSGSLIFLSKTDLKPLAQINFFHLGIFRLLLEAGRIRRARADLYCERMEFRSIQ